MFAELMVRGTVSGSQYGQASITSEGLRLVVDGVEVEPTGFFGEANVPEGESREFLIGFVAPRPVDAISITFTSDDGQVGTIELQAQAPGT